MTEHPTDVTALLHDLAQPLAVIDGYLVALGAQTELSDKAAAWVRLARDASGEALGLVDAIGRALRAEARQPNRRVVLVEDNAALSSMLTVLLERDGWTVTATAEPSAVIDVVDKADPSVVLVDLHLGASSGLDLVHSLEAAFPALVGRMAFVTGDRTADLGGRDALFKPFRWAEVDALLRRLTPRADGAEAK